MQLQHSTWKEVEAYLREASGILIPIGSTEQHGPNGLVGTDALCPEGVARRVGEEEGALVAPTLSVGMSQHHMAFPGTLTLRPSTLLELVRDVVGSLARHGFARVYFLNGHGGNVPTLQAAFAEIYAARPETSSGQGVHLRLRNWWSGRRVRELSQRLFGNADGSHATASEVSLSYFLHPGSVKEDVEMSPRIAPTGPIRDAADYRRRFPDGRIGSDPSMASLDAGEKLFEAAVADVREDWRSFLEKA